MIASYAAWLFAVLAAIVVLFQVGLICGLPWGEFTMGGRWRGRLPVQGRLAVLVSVVVLTAQAVVILSRSGSAFPQFQAISRSLVWGVVAFCALGSIMNAVTPSKRERRLWLPVVLGMLACSLVVARG